MSRFSFKRFDDLEADVKKLHEEGFLWFVLDLFFLGLAGVFDLLALEVFFGVVLLVVALRLFQIKQRYWLIQFEKAKKGF